MTCGCRKDVNEKLASSNAKIGMGLLFGFESATMREAPPMIVLEKVDDKKRGKIPHLVATFCPFCGVRYENS